MRTPSREEVARVEWEGCLLIPPKGRSARVVRRREITRLRAAGLLVPDGALAAQSAGRHTLPPESSRSLDPGRVEIGEPGERQDGRDGRRRGPVPCCHSSESQRGTGFCNWDVGDSGGLPIDRHLGGGYILKASPLRFLPPIPGRSPGGRLVSSCEEANSPLASRAGHGCGYRAGTDIYRSVIGS